MKTKRLGELLIEYSLITKEQLQEALTYQTKNGVLIGEALLRLGYLDNGQIVSALAQHQTDHIKFKKEIGSLLARLFPNHPYSAELLHLLRM